MVHFIGVLLGFSSVPVFAGTLQTSTESPWYLQQCCKHQPTRRGLCNNVASVNRPAVVFATMLQTSTEPPWPLQQCCKRQPNRRGLCNNVASVNRTAVAFAGTLQTSTESPRPLQERCKRQPNRRGLCRNAANVNLIIHDPLPPEQSPRKSVDELRDRPEPFTAALEHFNEPIQALHGSAATVSGD